MAMRRLVVGTALLMTLAVGITLRPRPAVASDNLQYIIPAAAAGVAAVVLIIAIIIAEHKGEPELDLADRLPPPDPPAHGIRFGPACAPTANGIPLLCW